MCRRNKKYVLRIEGYKMIKTFVGPMHSGKTAALMLEYNKIYNKEHVKCFKPLF